MPTQHTLCTNPACRALDARPHSHLSLPDPCPHLTRLAYIRARLDCDTDFLDRAERHLRDCPDRAF